MTERKPINISFTSWIDQQIDEAKERGAFEGLPGAGKPLPRRDEASGSQAWLQDYLRRQGVSPEDLLPTPLRLRKEVERLTANVGELHTEREVRELAAELNRQILQWRRIPEGPPVYLRLVDADALVSRWRETHPALPAAPAPALQARSSPLRWWRRRRQRLAQPRCQSSPLPSRTAVSRTRSAARGPGGAPEPARSGGR
jgi:hypothetical protein